MTATVLPPNEESSNYIYTTLDHFKFEFDHYKEERMNKVSNIRKGVKNRRFYVQLSGLIPIIEIILFYIVFSLVEAKPVHAKTFNIASGDVAGLVNAINQANSNGQRNTIKLAAGSYTLTAVDNTTDGANGLPSITGNITITGAKTNITVIERDVNAPSFRIFHVSATGTLNLIGLTVKGGFIECCDVGGGIFNDGILTITNSIISDNSAAFEGGGIAGNGQVTITKSTISHNSAQDGGGILNNNGPVTITSSIISINSAEGFGGAIFGGVPLTIIDSTITGNSTQFFGGGIASGQMTIITTTIFNNSSGFVGGGIGLFQGSNPTKSTIINTTISNNTADSFGDGISNPAGSTLSIIDSAISDNSRSDGIDNNGGVIKIFNTTISNNVVGIENDSNGIVSIVNSTIADNTLGIFNPNDEFNPQGKVKLQNTILADNTRNGTDFDCLGSITSLGNNIIGNPHSCTVTLRLSDLTGDPRLGTFKDNGAPGNGHFPLLPNSRAIDAGNNAVCLANPVLATDQIGHSRIGVCDIGSIESQKLHR
jgi:hypothetical protein